MDRHVLISTCSSMNLAQHRQRLAQIVTESKMGDEVTVSREDLRAMLQDLAAAESRAEELHHLRLCDLKEK